MAIYIPLSELSGPALALAIEISEARLSTWDSDCRFSFDQLGRYGIRPKVLTIRPSDTPEHEMNLIKVGLVRQGTKESAAHVGLHIELTTTPVCHLDE